MKTLNLLKIRDLSTVQFHVAYYQRGYRWKEQQVKQLLDDLLKFTKSDAVPSYFLQVLIRSKSGNMWNIVDGQQRLTTIKLILEELNGQLHTQETIHLTYDRDEQGALDRYFIAQARKTIQQWLEINKGAIPDIQTKILDAQFLVYDLIPEEGEDIGDLENTVFSRVNSGKISAKDSELVKCIMLTVQPDEPAEITQCRATEWDEIERALNDEDFYAFLTPRNTPDAADRMARLFVASGFVPTNEDRKNQVFPYLDRILDDIKNTSRRSVWLKISNTFSRLQNWFSDNSTYHAVGWWIHSNPNGGNLQNLCSLGQVLLKLQEVASSIESLETKANLYYENWGGALRALYLFNVAYAWSNQHQRYDFRQHRAVSKWSLEHIMARNVRDLVELEFQEYRKIAASPDNFTWEEYQEQCKQSQGEQYLERMLGQDEYPSQEDNSLGNLALIPQSANSALSNHLFRQKRTQVNEWNSTPNVYFIPPATVAVFNKELATVINNELKEMNVTTPYLNQNDKAAYLQSMKAIVERFITNCKERENND